MTVVNRQDIITTTGGTADDLTMKQYYDTITTGKPLTYDSSAKSNWVISNGTATTFNYDPLQASIDNIEEGCCTLKDGTQVWVQRGALHRKDGPAIVNEADGVRRWFLKGKELSKKSFKNIEMVNEMQAWELFTPVEIAEMRQRQIEIDKTKAALKL